MAVIRKLFRPRGRATRVFPPALCPFPNLKRLALDIKIHRPGRRREENHEFKVILNYTVSLRSVSMHHETLFSTKQNNPTLRRQS